MNNDAWVWMESNVYLQPTNNPQVYLPKIPRSIYARESQSIRYYLRQISVYTCTSIMHPPNPEHRK